MNLTRWPVTVVYAVLLLGCVGFALYQTWGAMFAMGESETAVGLVAGAFLIVTVLGAAGLVIGALGSWTRWRSYSVIALVGALGVLPMAALFCRQNRGAIDFLAIALDLAAVSLSWLRFRQLA
ncbi:MAG TPA: hypothetical protein VMR02_12095 [Terracidiphilus sp.]|jgi:hypothetical protein|nr:hypothetical protein [Terracidiphilus sp.]